MSDMRLQSLSMIVVTIVLCGDVAHGVIDVASWLALSNATMEIFDAVESSTLLTMTVTRSYNENQGKGSYEEFARNYTSKCGEPMVQFINSGNASDHSKGTAIGDDCSVTWAFIWSAAQDDSLVTSPGIDMSLFIDCGVWLSDGRTRWTTFAVGMWALYENKELINWYLGWPSC